METQEAIKIIRQVTSMYKGTLQEHQAIQEAHKVIEDALKNKPIEDAEKKKK